MKLLFLGDIFAGPGRRAVEAALPGLRARHQADLVIVNGENMAGGLGVEPRLGRKLLSAGVDVMTTGNHVWVVRGIGEWLDQEPRVVRPANYPAPCPGRGMTVVHTAAGVPVAVLNLQGRLFMDAIDCPFAAADRLLVELAGRAQVVVADFHAEATSEKQALAYHLAGRVSLLVGTHTHVQTADERIIGGHTAFISDAGMCGAADSIIGMTPAPVVEHFRSRRKTPFKPAEGPAVVCGVVVEVDEATGAALGIERIRQEVGV